MNQMSRTALAVASTACVLPAVAAAQPLTGVPIDPIIVDCAEGQMELIVTTPDWILSAWEDAPDWDFILTDGSGNPLS